MENCLPFIDDVMVVLVHKCVQQTHLLALHLETNYFKTTTRHTTLKLIGVIANNGLTTKSSYATTFGLS